VRLCDVHEAKMHIHIEDIPEENARSPASLARKPSAERVQTQVIEVFAISTDCGVWTTGPLNVAELEREAAPPPEAPRAYAF